MADKIPLKTISSLRAGSHKAFEEVFLLYFDRVRIFIEKIIRSEEDAEELAQEVFVKLWNLHEKIDSDRSFDALLFSMSHNLAFNYLRHRLVHQTYLTSLPDKLVEESIEGELYAKEISLLIEMALNSMPEQRRMIFTLSRQEGLSNTEIAEKLSISKKTVENQLSLALKELRKIISLFLLFMS